MSPQGTYTTGKLDELRKALAQVDALPQLSLIAVLVGICTGLIIVAFRVALDTPHLFLPMSEVDEFESLSLPARTALILAGTLVIACAIHKLDKYKRQMSVGHVIDRLHNHQGNLPGANTIAQFILAVVAVTTGHSVGREGPAVHLGAGAASRVGSWMRLPNNSMQTILACGVAAAISASFDTPLAGVIFAMEVIVMEYTIVGFVPVILASVIGATTCKAILGAPVIFDTQVEQIDSLIELGCIVVAGLVIAILAAAFIKLNILTLKRIQLSAFNKIILAGCLTAAVAAFVPEIMGLGYDTIQATLNGELLATALIIIALAKLFTTPIVVALGIPGGLIGPSLFVGACVGFILGVCAQKIFPGLNINLSVYVLLGMTGMMAAVINAPLAALIAILELSNSTNIIFPAMLIIVVSCLTTRKVFNLRGIFIEQLAHTGRDIEIGPASRALKRAGVISIMDRRFLLVDESVSLETAKYIVGNQPQWVIFSYQDRLHALPTSDLAHFLENLPEHLLENLPEHLVDKSKTESTNDEAIITEGKESLIHLIEVPGRRHMLQPVLESESLYGALLAMRKSSCEVVYVTSNVLSHRSVHGIVTLEAIQNHYQPKELSRALG